MIDITFNGHLAATAAETVAGLLTEQSVSSRGVAVAVNGHVIPRSEWQQSRLHAGDIIEVVTAAAGG